MLQVENVHKSYYLGRTALPVLKGVSLKLARGEFVAITGASGSGKSTLLHVMSGLDVPQRGQVRFQGSKLFEPEGLRRIPVGRDSSLHQNEQGRRHPPSAAGHGDLRLIESHRNELRNRGFGFVFQFYHLLPEFDVLENIMLPLMVGQSMGGWLSGRITATERAKSLLQRVGLQDRMAHRPNELSGGERQRVSIARALINEPAVLFADEPTGNLDSRTGRGIIDLLKELNAGGQTIAMVTHDPGLTNESDRVIHLVDGRLA